MEYSHVGNAVGSNKKTYNNTWSDDPRVTRKETVQYAHAGNASKGGVASMNRGMFMGSDILPK